MNCHHSYSVSNLVISPDCLSVGLSIGHPMACSVLASKQCERGRMAGFPSEWTRCATGTAIERPESSPYSQVVERAGLGVLTDYSSGGIGQLLTKNHCEKGSYSENSDQRGDNHRQ
jgi:hypothetical protein